ncbi:hypothetical protein D3C85_1247860 [compost metagenome]
MSGIAPCPPVAWMTMVTLSVEAMQGPDRTPNLPIGMPGELCSAKSASHGNRRNTPSSSMRLAPEPPWPSSAGWKNSCRVPRQAVLCERA